MRSFLAGSLLALASALGANAASSNSSAYSDASTGIDFQRWCDEDTGFCFGVALPETVKTDFVGQMVVPLSSSKGWGGVSLGGSMTSALLVAAWPNGNNAVGTLRKTTSYTNPDVYSDATITEIPDGTSVNSTHLTYTFLCRNCVVGSPTTFSASDDTYFFGWALSKQNPTTPSSASSVLTYHAAGFGTFEMLLGQAKSASYSKWAAMAKKVSSTPSSSASVSASPSSTPAPSVAPTISNSTYDYIVVGGGAAGIIAAERLVEANKKVLLIERGAASTAAMGADDTLSWNKTLTPYDVPALGSSLSELGLIGDYLCPDTAGMAGCVLGGSTIINALAFIHPQSADFDDKWPSGWKWSDVEAASKRLYERNPGSMLPSADGKRYDQGMYKVLSSFLSGLGWKSVNQQEQPNAKHQVYSYPSWSLANGIRAGPVRSYLPLAQKNNNFTLHLQTKVRRLIRRGGRVSGVEVEKPSGAIEIIHVRASGKVILAAGALSTPRILFNSGIGPSKQIKTVQSGSTGITLPPSTEWINLPVGQNLKDHPMFTITVDTTSNFTKFNTSSVVSSSGPDAFAKRLYAQGSGVLSQGGHRLQFWTSNEGSDGVTRFYQGSCSVKSDGVITMKLYLTHGATSSGVLGINAAGSTVLETDPWLQTDADKAAAKEFLQSLLSDMESSGFSVRGVSSAEEILAAKTSGDHWVGTAKMGTDDGRKGNGSSVVDTDTKVYGTENLFVVDASIHPDLPTGNTQAIVMIAAEAAVAKILGLPAGSSAGGASSSAMAYSTPAQKTAVASASASVSTLSVGDSSSSAATTATPTAAVSTSPVPSLTGVEGENGGVYTVTSYVTSTSWTTTTEVVVTTSTRTVTVMPTFT